MAIATGTDPVLVAQAIDDDDSLDIRDEAEEKSVTEAAFEVYNDALKKWLKAGLEHAQNINRSQRDKMRVYRQRRQGRWGEYAGDDNRTRIYRAMIGKLIQVYKAIVIPNLVPNPDSMDWLEVKSYAPGFDEYVRDVQAVMRRDFVLAYSDEDESFLQMVDACFDDFCTYGVSLSTEQLEIIEGDWNSDGHISSRPTPQRLSVFDVLPWDVDVDRPCQTNISVWTPKTEDEIYRTLGKERADELVKKVTAIDHRSDQEDGEPGRLDRDMWSDVTSSQKLYPGYVHYVRMPIRAILDHAEGTDEEREVLYEAGLEGLAQVYSLIENFDVPKALETKWWMITTVGDEPIEVKPYTLRLPPGGSPIVKSDFVHVNGQFWPMGFYDIAGVDEAAHNRMNAAAMKLAELAADPPLAFFKGMVDEAWLQEHGGEFPALTPGLRAMLKEGMEKDPFKVIEAAYETLSLVIELRDGFEAQLRNLLGISSDLEGQSKARTATQNVNNVQFGMAPINYTTLRFRSSFMHEHAVRGYLARQQAMRIMEEEIPGYREYAPMDYSTQRLKIAGVTAQHFIDLEWMMFEITGPDQDSSRASDIQNMMDVYRTAMPSGDLVGSELLLEIFKTMRKVNPKRFLTRYAGLNEQEALMNLIAAFGAEANQLPPEYMLATGAPLLPPPPMPAGPGSEAPPEEGGLPGAPNVMGSPEMGQPLPNQPIQNFATTQFRKAATSL